MKRIMDLIYAFIFTFVLIYGTKLQYFFKGRSNIQQLERVFYQFKVSSATV